MRLNFNENIRDDLAAILAFIEGMSYSENEAIPKTAIDTQRMQAILHGIRTDFPHKDGQDGIAKASIFKKAATFLVYFISEKPISSVKVGNMEIPDEIRNIPNYINTVVGLLIALACLHRATIQSGRKEKILENKIKLSRHSFVDLIEALSRSTPVTHFNMVAVLLEQMAYKSNPDCQYELFEVI